MALVVRPANFLPRRRRRQVRGTRTQGGGREMAGGGAPSQAFVLRKPHTMPWLVGGETGQQVSRGPPRTGEKLCPLVPKVQRMERRRRTRGGDGRFYKVKNKNLLARPKKLGITLLRHLNPFIDTAGIRRRAVVAAAGSTTESLSVKRAFRAIHRSDVVALVIEALACITEQAAVGPPTFMFFVNDAKLFPETYRRYMEKKLRTDVGYPGTPIRLLWRSRRRPDKTGKSADNNLHPGTPSRMVVAA